VHYLKLKNIVALFFFAVVAIRFISPVIDPDFPWHLKTGEYIYQHREIPKTDPFGIISTGDIREKFILRGYWLGQLMYYGIFSFSGLAGIVVLRSLFLTGIIIILWFAMKHAPILMKMGILFLTAHLFLVGYSGDRPQLFSFFFGPAVIAMLEHYRRTMSAKLLLVLPFLMCIWANVHGGYIFGNVAIAVFCFFEVLKYFFLREKSASLTQKSLLLLTVIGLISIAASYCNPNHFQALSLTFETRGDAIYQYIKEYHSPIVETRGAFANTGNFIYWGIMGYCLVLLALNLRRLDLTDLGLVFFSLYISLTAVRFVPFFLAAGLLISGKYKFNIIDPDRLSRLKRLEKPVAAVALLSVLLWGGLLVRSMPALKALNTMQESRLYPVKAARFLSENLEGGRIFSSYNIGSFLLWQLYPKFKTFVDTRGLNYEVLAMIELVSNAKRSEDDKYFFVDALAALLPMRNGKVAIDMGKRPAKLPATELWSDLLTRYDIDIIVHEASNLFSGSLYPLVLRLASDKDWRLIYSDGIVLVFVRDVAKFGNLISKYELDKKRIYDEIGIENVNKVGRAHSAIYSSLAFALLMKGGADKIIEEYIAHALYLEPDDLLANYLEAFLKLKKAERDKPLSASSEKNKEN